MAFDVFPSCYAKELDRCPTCVDLFCGAGGLSLGFCQAGGVPVAAVDNDSFSMDTYRRMFPMCSATFCGDIEAWIPSSLTRSPDFIIGGPPCQGFSLARGFRFVDDPRNHLYKYFIKFVDHFRPSWVVMENVPGITNIGKGVILRQIYEDFHAIGYWLDHIPSRTRSRRECLLLDYDAYDHQQLGMTLKDVINNPKRKMGHAFVLAMMLQNKLEDCLK